MLKEIPSQVQPAVKINKGYDGQYRTKLKYKYLIQNMFGYI